MPKGLHNFIDLTGSRLDRLLVISRAPSVASGTAWNCRCDCGTEFVRSASNLKSGAQMCKACAALRAGENLAGRRFGRLVVTNTFERRGGRRFWRCICDCGNDHWARPQPLKLGKIQSCGCLARERASEANTTHGMSQSKHPVYTAWENMRQRCLNEKSPWFHRYGGRGITICERWADAQVFIDDMMPTWAEGLTIDRIDPDGNYEPSNCRWITQAEQLSNRSDTIWLEINGEKMPIALASKRFGVNAQTIRYRWHHGYRGRDLITRPK